MIEKIPDQIHVQTGEFRGTAFDIIPKETFAMACRKINELIDAVNELLVVKKIIFRPIDALNDTIENTTNSKMESVQDKFAEQRKIVKGGDNE